MMPGAPIRARGTTGSTWAPDPVERGTPPFSPSLPTRDTVATAPESSTSLQTGATGRDAAAQWADFARTATLYPETSQRVAAAFEAMGTAIRTAGGGQPLTITMTQDELVIGGRRSEIAAGSKAAWLRERLRSGGLDGVTFAPSLTLAALRDFTLRLTEVHARGKELLDQASRWPKAFPGITLIHRAFDGAFSEQHAEGPGLTSEDSGNRDLDGDDGPGDALVGRLSVEGPVSASVTRISEQLAGITLPGESDVLENRKLARKLLQYVVQCIPSEDRDAYDVTVSTTNNILSSLEEILVAEGSSTEELNHADDVNLRALVYAASRRLFSREMPPVEERELEEREQRGHAGDDEVHDDLSSLLLELNGLPIAHDIQLSHAEIDSTVEQFRMVLWLYTERRDEIDLEDLLRRAARMLRDVRDDELPALRAFIESQLSADDNPETREAIVRFFSDARQARLLRACGLLTPGQVAHAFPQDFGVFVDGIDLGDPVDRADFDAALLAIPAERILGCMPSLLDGPESLLIQGRAQRLLSTGSPQLLPFVEAVLALPGNPCREAVVAYLREAGREHAGSALLEVTTEPTAATTDYLRGLARCVQYNGTFPDVMEHQLQVLTGMLDTPGTSDRAKGKIIRALGRIACPASLSLLRRLASKKFGLFNRESAEVRLAARDRVQWLERGSSGGNGNV